VEIGRGNRSTCRKPAPAPLCPPQIPHDQTRARTPGRRGGKPATNRLSYGAAFAKDFMSVKQNSEKNMRTCGRLMERRREKLLDRKCDHIYLVLASELLRTRSVGHVTRVE
jgi:hypothetical protein